MCDQQAKLDRVADELGKINAQIGNTRKGSMMNSELKIG